MTAKDGGMAGVERGIVVEVDGGAILVETAAGPSCEGCAAGHSCALIGSTARRRIRMENTLGARVGDGVAFIVEGRAVVAGSLLFYLLPAVMLVAGVLLGGGFGGRAGADRELASVLGGLAGLIMSFPAVAALSAALKKRRGFSPRLVEVAGRNHELI